jgi:hypothetical protein
MFSRVQMALAITGALLALSTTAALAKGKFAFISVAGGSLNSEIRLYDAAVTLDWFVFADLGGGRVPAPASTPQGGYEITRYYIDGRRAVAFDHLHYYPQAGLVYYDGIVNGWSDYDGKWYQAKPGIKAIFEKDVQYAAMEEALRRLPFIRRS